MRRTIHLYQRGLPPPLKCLACGEVAKITTVAHRLRHIPAMCLNHSDWDTIYKDHKDYRRCIDNPDERDKRNTKVYPTPTESGYYWAEWRIAEDWTWPEGFAEHKPELFAGVVEVWDDNFGFDGVSNFKACVPGFEKDQPLENFVWRSNKLEVPR